MLELVQQLISTLDKNKIVYCHWKSNVNLQKAVSGEDDLDLLVSRNNKCSFETAIRSLNFKPVSSKFIAFPGVSHFYGYDLTGDKIVHLHVYYQVITGSSVTKAHVFNIEEEVLRHRVTDHPLRMPVPQRYMEYVIYMIRLMIKLSSICEHARVCRHLDEIWREIDYLYNGRDDQQIASFLENYFPSITPEFLKNCLVSVKEKKHITSYLLGKKIRWNLHRYRRMSRFNELAQLLFQLFYRTLNKLLLHEKKRFKSGGIMIAIVGADATGKTTICNQIHEWLGENFTAFKVHVGKPPSSLLTFPLNMLVRIMKLCKGKGDMRTSTKKGCKGSSWPLAVRLSMLSFDRMRLTRRFWRKSVSGKIVIFDRYPSSTVGAMDSQRMVPCDVKGLKKLLARWEEHCYSLIPIPDIVFQLHVPVEVAVQRNDMRKKEGKEADEFIRLRHEENSHLSYNGRLVYSIDTSRDYSVVIGQIKKLIWQNL